MKSIILDTDIGVDCDDAAALGLLLNAEKKKRCDLLAITASTTRKGAIATLNTILKYYGRENVPLGILKGEPLACDAMNNYAIAVLEKYGENDEAEDATKVLRRTLANAAEQVDLVVIGPLTNIKNLLQSVPDEYSPLNGEELVKAKVGKMYLMGGAFIENYENVERIFTEWNILQDIPSARYVAEKFPCEILYSPHEIGKRVKTKMQCSDNPVWFSMKAFAISDGQTYEPEFYRQSWDPVTCMVALDEESELFSYSEYGKISINERGATVFEKQKGVHRFMLVNDRLADVEKLLNELIERQ